MATTAVNPGRRLLDRMTGLDRATTPFVLQIRNVT
jgi:hypothetical protein